MMYNNSEKFFLTWFTMHLCKVHNIRQTKIPFVTFRIALGRVCIAIECRLIFSSLWFTINLHFIQTAILMSQIKIDGKNDKTIDIFLSKRTLTEYCLACWILFLFMNFHET